MKGSLALCAGKLQKFFGKLEKIRRIDHCAGLF